MDPSSNLHSLSYFQYETLMTPNDERQENPSTQNYNSSQQPPGAEVAGPPTFTYPGQAEPPLQDSLQQGHANLEEDTSQMLTQLSVSFQGDEPETSLYPPSPRCSVSPTPSRTSQVSLPGNWNSSFPTADTLGSLFQHHIPTHSRSVSQPSTMPTRTQRGRRGPTRAGANAVSPRYSRLSPSTMHTPLPTPVSTPCFVQLPLVLHGAPDLTHEGSTRRHSEADVLGAQGTLPWLSYTLIHPAAPAMCQPHPDERPSFSLTPSSSQGLFAGFTEVGTDGGYLPDQLPTPSGSQEDSWVSVSSMTPSPEPFSVAESDAPGAPSQTADHLPPQNGILPASPLLLGTGPPGETPGAAKGLKNYARTGKRNRDAVDKKAAKRLKGQREMDEEYIVALWNLFVPKSENVGMKKDRLKKIAHCAKRWMEAHRKSVLSYAIPLNHHYRAGEGSVSHTEDGVFQEQGQLVRSNDSVQGFATYLNVNDLGVNDTMGSTSSALQKHDTLFAHRPN
ncbi:hypothetical protein EDB92DRAFT_848490 [Lactarius akahatsu]|uniref:Uncharacterized protein n=1 Tax=Lactarius akahatsu TaxID=416441 RepID=A0AAD4LHF3_9AGAM|nr:hypothetical protein EDB92DRAFT_848490 [Lactarius akahatsu]